MNKVIEYLKSLNYQPHFQDIKVYGWEFCYDHHMISSVFPYLFEDLVINENIAGKENENRDGRIRPKHYIVIHDTGDTTSNRNAKYWSDVVKSQNYEGKKYQASFQYVVGSDGIYHNIPDNEIAYHAGDSTYYDYTLYNTGIASCEQCDISINDGYYYINNQKTLVKAPLSNKVLTNADFNDDGILCVIQDGFFYIGETYFNETYQLIANRGGNNNGIGIEMCINEGSDIYLNYQRLAKLCAYLMKKEHLEIKDIRPHHYFSGKDCPMTARKNHLWDEFIELVKVEKQMLSFKEEGYLIELIPLTNNVLKNGRLKKQETTRFIVRTTKDGQVDEYEFTQNPSC